MTVSDIEKETKNGDKREVLVNPEGYDAEKLVTGKAVDTSSRTAKLPPCLMTVLISILMSALSIFVYDRFFTQKVVSMDIKGFIAEQRDLYMTGKIDEKQFEANIDKLEARVKGIPKNQVVIMGDAVVKNAEVINP